MVSRSGIVADNADFQSSNEPEIVSNQYITESNAVSIYVNASYLFTYLLLICKL